MTKTQEFKARFQEMNYQQLSDEELDNYNSEFNERISECSYHISLRSYKRRHKEYSAAVLAEGKVLKNEYLYQVSDSELAEYHSFLILEFSKIQWVIRSRSFIKSHFPKKENA